MKLPKLQLYTKVLIGLLAGVLFGVLANKCGFSDFIFKYIAYSRENDFYEYKKVFVEQLPIIPLPRKKQVPFNTLVDGIQAGKSRGEDTATMEQEIDRMVYKLYGLTGKEIGCIEGTL